MSFFLELNWKKIEILIIFYALFAMLPLVRAGSDGTGSKDSSVSEVETDKRELNRCLAEVLLNADKNERAHEKVLLSLAGVLSGDDIKGYGDYVNLDLLKDLKSNTEEGDKLVRKVYSFCDYFDAEISELNISNEEKVKLKVRVDELKSSAERFGLLVNRPERKLVQHRNCRILDVSEKLQLVVISAGHLDGIRNGLTWKVKQADDAVLKVIAVRPFVCAAVVIEGELDKIRPGMLAEFGSK